ncbi:MAG TPA: DUF4347 domain-containing protein, partial [Pirellulales bacterium]|nr:DUF4347 domain-containing protein [Pirellulales bacterium]
MSIRQWLNQFRAVTHDALQGPGGQRARISTLDIGQLEDRIMFSAAPMDVMPAEGDLDPLASAESLVLPADSSSIFENPAVASNEINTTQDNTPQGAAREVIFVDTSVDNYQQLVDDLLNNSDETRELEVHLLDAERDGIEQITKQLAQHHDLDAIH